MDSARAFDSSGATAARTSAWPDARAGSGRTDRHPVRPALGRPLADAAARDGLRVRQYLLATARAVATCRRLAAIA